MLCFLPVNINICIVIAFFNSQILTFSICLKLQTRSLTCPYFTIPMARQVMASSQEENNEEFTPLTGINVHSGNIIDFREKMSTCTCHAQIKLLGDKILRKQNLAGNLTKQFGNFAAFTGNISYSNSTMCN